MNELETLRAKVAGLEASNAALYLVIAAMIQTFPRYHDFQLVLTALLEVQLPGGGLARELTPAQKAMVREAVENLQRIEPLSEGAPARALQHALPPHGD
ncbi:MAG: hypothetical protein V4505_19405 [Pseudomonadota bacterium]